MCNRKHKSVDNFYKLEIAYKIQHFSNYNCFYLGVQNEGNAGKPNGNRPQDQLIPPSHGGYRPQPNSPTTGGTTTANNQTYPSKLAPNQNCSTYGLLYQNPEDCSTYFMCNQRRLVLVHCTRGYFYIPERKRCETTYPTGCKFVEHNLGDSKPIYETENDVWQYQRSLKG